MPDYTSILRRSLAALSDDSPALRQAIYARARSALMRQLAAVDPPLSEAEIAAQQEQLEDSIAEIEAEFDAAGTAEDAAAVPAAPSPPAAPPPPAAPSRPASPPPPAPAAGDGGAGMRPAAMPPAAAKPADAPAPAEEEERAARANRHQAVLADDDEAPEEAPPSSRMPALVMLALLALVLLGAGVLAYSQRDTLAAMLGWSGEAPQQAAETPPAGAAPPEAAPDAAGRRKSDERLANGSAAPGENTAAGEATESAEAPTELAEPGADGAADAQPQAAAPAAPDSAAPEMGTAAAEPPAAAEPAPGASIVAQRAIFYEQGDGGASGRATQGTVAWQRVERPDGLPAVEAAIRLEEQDVTVTITIAKNTDQDLPASHMVEIAVAGGGKLSDAALERVPALVLKPNEQARGQPLAGAAVPVTDTLFWIALSDEDEQIARNLSLLRDGSWFDLPLLFVGGKRALLTFEKGIAGDKVFETVLQAWSQS